MAFYITNGNPARYQAGNTTSKINPKYLFQLFCKTPLFFFYSILISANIYSIIRSLKAEVCTLRYFQICAPLQKAFLVRTDCPATIDALTLKFQRYVSEVNERPPENCEDCTEDPLLTSAESADEFLARLDQLIFERTLTTTRYSRSTVRRSHGRKRHISSSPRPPAAKQHLRLTSRPTVLTTSPTTASCSTAPIFPSHRSRRRSTSATAAWRY